MERERDGQDIRKGRNGIIFLSRFTAVERRRCKERNIGRINIIVSLTLGSHLIAAAAAAAGAACCWCSRCCCCCCWCWCSRCCCCCNYLNMKSGLIQSWTRTWHSLEQLQSMESIMPIPILFKRYKRSLPPTVAAKAVQWQSFQA